MPNREAVVQVLTQDVLGAQRWNGLLRECQSMPTDHYDAVQDAMEAVLERLARAVDWNRLLREAASRHLHLHHERETEPFVDGVCGECLAEALLTDETGGTADWNRRPDAPRRYPNLDWPAVVADNLAYRQAAHWHPYMPPTTQEPPSAGPRAVE